MVATLQRRPKASTTDTTRGRLASTLTVAPSEEHEISTWRVDAWVVHENAKGVKRYLRRSSLQYLLGQVHEGQPFRLKNLMLSEEHKFGPNEFNLATNWMLANGLINKDGRKYMIPSIESIKRRWNEIVVEEAVL